MRQRKCWRMIGNTADDETNGENRMYDLAVENAAPGVCEKCRGSGVYRWGANVNGKTTNSGPCFSCKGTGKQSTKQIRNNRTYNRHKIARICSADFHRDPGEDAADRWNETHN